MVFGKATGGGRREVCRETAPLCVTLTTVSNSCTAELVDISATGARLQALECPSVGEEMFLAVERVKSSCTVRWTSDFEFGVQFYEPLLQTDIVSVRREAAKGVGVDPSMRAAMEDWVLGWAR